MLIKCLDTGASFTEGILNKAHWLFEKLLLEGSLEMMVLERHTVGRVG